MSATVDSRPAPPTLVGYAAALTLPLVGALSLFGGGWWSFALIVEAFVIVPLLDVTLSPRRDTAPREVYAERARDRRYTWMLHFLGWTVLAGVSVYCVRAVHADWTWIERIGATLSIGNLLGAGGLVVAHELGHRRRAVDSAMAQALLHATWYPHFQVEHNEGHHVHVATPHDPATARLGEGFWRFFPRVVFGTLASASRIGAGMARRAGRTGLGIGNPMVRVGVVQLGLSAAVLWLLGPLGLVSWFVVGVVGFLHLEIVDYIEHYGLLRSCDADGEYEPVTPQHSWSSDHPAGRLLLFELPRHSDHHAQASRPYQALRSIEGSPQMPAGYPSMMLLALVPPLWCRVMDPRARAVAAASS